MKPEKKAQTLFAMTRSKAKMFEFGVPEQEHIEITQRLTRLYDLTIAILGDLCNSNSDVPRQLENRDALFSAQYFDALRNSRMATGDGDYLLLLGASAFYLAGFPGSAAVLSGMVKDANVEAEGLDQLVHSCLTAQPVEPNSLPPDSVFRGSILRLSERMTEFAASGSGEDEIRSLAKELKTLAHERGSDRGLLFGDIAACLCARHLDYSLWTALPRFSGLGRESWAPFISHNKFMSELWPAQVLIGEAGILTGQSTIIQMPTSAGKTKATELILRAAILNNRSRLSVVVAPFRALCQEIANSLERSFADSPNVFVNLASDVLQMDLENPEDNFEILVLTPEKLEYMLRHVPEKAHDVGVMIYDEGHLFDDPSRGVKYELLLSSLQKRLSNGTQVVLISAVMPNVREVGRWLIGEDCEPVSAAHLTPTARSIAFTSWTERRGRLWFVNPEHPDVAEFFVPWLLESQKLRLKPRERKEQSYPAQDNGAHDPGGIAMLLACRAVANGSVAIFVGRKDSAAKIVNQFLDALGRGLELQQPSRVADQDELGRILSYVSETLGPDSHQASAARIGILLHHRSIPHGMRLATEYALQEQHVRLVVCTSTLAQGVNLPIRYLIVTTDKQGGREIRTRDFHNLMGRAGRAGKYTEGTVIFADPRIYDRQKVRNELWRWQRAQELLNPDRSEKCGSHILRYFDPKPSHINPKQQGVLVDEWEEMRAEIEKEIGAFLLAELSEYKTMEEASAHLEAVVEGTFAFQQADPVQKRELHVIFERIASAIFRTEPDSGRRQAFSKSILTLDESMRLSDAIQELVPAIAEEENEDELLRILWNCLYSASARLQSILSSEKHYELCCAWVRGDGFPNVLRLIDAKIGARQPMIDHAVDLCENAYGFELSLILGACVELLHMSDDWNPDQDRKLQILQKRLKYGLPDALAVTVYELGFSDRQLAERIAEATGLDRSELRKRRVRRAILAEVDAVRGVLSGYPAYFRRKLDDVLAEA